jgi:hypothetical protein
MVNTSNYMHDYSAGSSTVGSASAVGASAAASPGAAALRDEWTYGFSEMEDTRNLMGSSGCLITTL